MNTSAEALLADLASLPALEQQAVAEAVVLGPEESDPLAWDRAWLDEVHRRRARGLDDAVPVEAFASRARSRWPKP
jgi:hypothetical protein